MRRDETAAVNLRLATRNGRRLPVANVPASGVAEPVMVIRFEGMTEAEQRRLLAGFPGGKRFRLESDLERQAG